MNMKHWTRRAVAGFTIVELVVVVMIIGMLVLIMTPVLTRRSEEARIAAAHKDMQHLADSLERAFIQTNYLYRLDVLNDGIRGDGIANSSPLSKLQGITDVGLTGGLYGTVPHSIFISLESQSFPPNQTEIFSRLMRSETNFGWQGPYLNWHRDANQNDWPDDPWGNDYLLFTVNGVIYPPVNQPVAEQNSGWQFQILGPSHLVSDGSGGSTPLQYDAAYLFDRPTLLSMGPNGLPGNGTDDPNDGYGEGDDIVYSFAAGQ